MSGILWVITIALWVSQDAWQGLEMEAIYKHDQRSPSNSRELLHPLNTGESTYSIKSWTLGVGNFVVCDEKTTFYVFFVQQKSVSYIISKV